MIQLRNFVVAAELGSMTWAAEELYVAQSAVSTSISNLEQALGARLVIRSRGRGLQVTDKGAELLQRARRILADVDEAVGAVSPENTAGRVSVGCFRTLAPFYLPTIITALSARHPEVEVDVHELFAPQIGERLQDETIEIALTYDLGLGPEVEREVLASVPMYVAVGRDHPLATRDAVSLAELESEPMVLLDLPVSRDYFLEAFTRLGLRPTVRFRFENFEAVRAMVASGHGYTVLNQQPKLEYTYAGSALRRLEIREPVAPLDLVLARARTQSRRSRRSELFAHECRRAVATHAVGQEAPGR
ncbi:LysR family transcriptional regulator [Litorihabitans aurantiacus]|uniref:LysR family transcriptional regulator n=1 Tax=Litorihabitans aurantiacus TaxID=1930061 RepID=UPI0024E0CE77|nr:LysR family transcriptional regulator [Litorihabitans aurantiacus]